MARNCLAIAQSPTNTSSNTLHARRHDDCSVSDKEFVGDRAIAKQLRAMYFCELFSYIQYLGRSSSSIVSLRNNGRSSSDCLFCTYVWHTNHKFVLHFSHNPTIDDNNRQQWAPNSPASKTMASPRQRNRPTHPRTSPLPSSHRPRRRAKHAAPPIK